MVLKQIQNLLHDHDCVIIPDFGGLIAQYAPAKIHPVKHTFTPPSKKIAFNEKLKNNDGLLISSLSQHLRVPSEQAQQMVAQFVGNLQSGLAQSQRCELQGIGIFRYNAERKIEFEYLESEVNFLEHSFGLPELEARPIIPAEAAALRTIREKATPKQVPTGGNRFSRFSRKYATVASTVLIGGLTVAMVYLVSLQTEYNLSSLNPVSLFNTTSESLGASESTLATASEKVVDQVAESNLDALPVTPEETSVEAVEADYTEKYADLAPVKDESVDLHKLETRPVSLDGTSEIPKTAKEIAVKTTEAKPETAKAEAAKAVLKPAEKAESKAVAKSTEKIEPKKAGKSVEKVVAKASTETVEKNTAKANAIKTETGRYFIISGGYSSLANAERSKKELAAKGASSDIILPVKGSKLHRVSVADFGSMELATAKLPELRQKYGNSLWILNY